MLLPLNGLDTSACGSALACVHYHKLAVFGLLALGELLLHLVMVKVGLFHVIARGGLENVAILQVHVLSEVLVLAACRVDADHCAAKCVPLATTLIIHASVEVLGALEMVRNL